MLKQPISKEDKLKNKKVKKKLLTLCTILFFIVSLIIVIDGYYNILGKTIKIIICLTDIILYFPLTYLRANV